MVSLLHNLPQIRMENKDLPTEIQVLAPNKTREQLTAELQLIAKANEKAFAEEMQQLQQKYNVVVYAKPILTPEGLISAQVLIEGKL